MPITAQDKQQILAEAGVDSTKYWIDDNGEIIDMPAQGGFEAGVKSALYNAPRTLLGFMGGAGGAAGAGALSIASGPGAFVTGTAGALAGGAAGGALGDKIQSALYPAGWQFGEEARSVRNPMASFVGQTASQVATMRPSPKMFAQLAKAPGEFVRSAGQLTPSTAGAAMNILAGAAIPAGVALGTGGTAEDVAREAAIGALLSQPTRFGTLLSGGTFEPWKPGRTAAGSTGGMREAFQDRVAQQKAARAAEVEAINAQRRAAFDEAVARGEAPMPVDPVDPRESRMAPLEEELGVTSSEDWLAYLQDFGGKMKAKFAQADSVTADDGTPVAGRYTPRTGPGADASIDVSRSGYADTGPHEYLHAMIDDTLNYGTPREKAFMERVLAESGLSVEEVGGKRRVVGDLSEFTGPIEGGRARGEEDLVQRAGEDFVRRAVDPAKNDTFRGALKDFSEYYLKNRMTPEAAQRMLSGRLMHGRGTEPALRSAAGRAVRPLDLERERAEKLDLAEAAKLKAENDAREAAQLKAENDAREAADSARIRSNLALRDATDPLLAADEGGQVPPDEGGYEPSMSRPNYDQPEDTGATARRIDAANRAAEASRIRREGHLTYEMEQFPDTGGEMPAGEISPTEVQTSVPYDNKPNEVAPGSSVSRTVNRDYSGESIPASKYQPLMGDEAPAFATDFEKELSNARPFKVQVAKDGRMAAGDVRIAVSKLNPTEQALLKEAGLDAYLKTVVRPNAEDLKAWAAENLPRVEVRELGAGRQQNDAESAEMKANALKHELDTSYSGGIVKVRRLENSGIRTEDAIDQVAAEYGTRAHSFKHLMRKFEQALSESEAARRDDTKNDNDSATRRYDSANINPRQLKDMPGAVDLLVRLPRRDGGKHDEFVAKHGKLPTKAGYEWDGSSYKEAKLYSSNHYPQSGDNLLAHVRAYEHTMPDGEKVLRVFELQSDWAQDRRKQETYTKTLDNKLTAKFVDDIDHPGHKAWLVTMVDDTGYKNQRYSTKATESEAIEEAKELFYHGKPTAPHHLLPHHQRLALKAAIEHARKRGIKRVVIDDAETAMMTEGHDKIIDRARKDVADVNADLSNPNLIYSPEWYLPKLEGRYKNNGAKFEIQNGKIVMTRGPFEGGMGLSYDNVLQQMMRDLSGDGVKVEMGEHRNAVMYREGDGRAGTQARALHEDLVAGRITEEQYRTGVADARRNADEAYNQLVPRPDLIFKNADGTPKTQSTGIVYDVSAAQARRDAGEPFSYAGRRYQPLGPDEGSYKGAKLPPREQPRRGIFAGNVEALRRSGNPDKKYFAERADELYARIRNYAGKYESEILKPLLELSSADQKLLVGHMYDEDAAGHRMPVASQLRPAYNAMRKGLELMARDQIAAGQLIGGKARGVKDSYFPNGVDTTIIHDLTYNSNSARAQELERQYIDYNADRLMAATPRLTRAKAEAEARDSFASFRGSLKPMSIENGFDFGAVTMKEGGKLPATWMAADPVAGLRNYIKRFARSRAFYDVIQRDERAMASLGMENFYDAAGAQQPVTVKADNLNRDPNARALMESAIGVTHESQEGITPAIGRLANSLLLSNVMTRVTDVATTPFKALAYIPAGQVPGLIGHMSNMRKSIENAYRTGGVRRGDMMVIRDVLGAGDQMVRGMDKFSEQIVKWTGSEALEKGARFLAQNVGEYVYDVNVALANRGDKNATEFLNRLTPEWKNLAREEVAQRVAQLFQGRYDATNLPIWIANSPAAPFFSMMKWNIEQWNNFRRFAWQPAQQGNFRPLIGTLIGGALGGVAVGELREKISGKKQRVATLDELEFGFTEGDKGRTGMEAMRKAAFIAQVTGTLGVVGELALQALDIAAKDKPQGMSWPAFEMAANAIGKTQNAAAAMLEQPGDAGLIALNAAHDLMRDSFSQYRIAMSALDRTGADVGLAGGADQVEESNRRRDMRMSDKLRGEKTRFSPFIEADYGKTREKRMDKTNDLAEARELGAELKSQARERSKTRDEYDSELAKLRSSRIVGIPSKENNPVQYRAHVEFVRRTQGDEAAQALQETYRRLRGSQQRKTSMFK